MGVLRREGVVGLEILGVNRKFNFQLTPNSARGAAGCLCLGRGVGGGQFQSRKFRTETFRGPKEGIGEPS